MFTTLVAVIAALVLGHVASTRVAALRRFQWYRGWLEYLVTHTAYSAQNTYTEAPTHY